MKFFKNRKIKKESENINYKLNDATISESERKRLLLEKKKLQNKYRKLNQVN